MIVSRLPFSPVPVAVRLTTAAVLAGLLAGCGSFGAVGLPSFGRSKAPEPAGIPAPTQPVEATPLPPAPGSAAPGQPGQITSAATVPPAGGDPFAASPAPAAAAPVTALNAVEVNRTDLLGGWTIASAAESCQLFMTLTTWTGGYRASTRNCTSDTLKSISAWNLDGKQIVLAGSAGSPVARLYGSASNRFDGQLEGLGTSISFYR